MRSDGKTGLGAGGLSPYPTVFSSSRGALAGSPAGSLARGGGRAAVALRAAPEGRLSRSAPRSAWALPLVRSLPRAFPPPPQPPPPCPATCVPLTPRSSCGTWPTTPGEWGRAPAGRGGCAGFGGLARPRGRLPPGGGRGPPAGGEGERPARCLLLLYLSPCLAFRALLHFPLPPRHAALFPSSPRGSVSKQRPERTKLGRKKVKLSYPRLSLSSGRARRDLRARFRDSRLCPLAMLGSRWSFECFSEIQRLLLEGRELRVCCGWVSAKFVAWLVPLVW